MTQQGSTPSRSGEKPDQRAATRAFDSQDVTDIIPLDELRDRGAVDCPGHIAAGRDAAVVHSPELDDMHDVDDLKPMRLAVPADLLAATSKRDPEQPRFANTENTDVLPRTPAHRRQPTGPVKGRVLIAAMAAGAAAAAVYTAVKPAGDTVTQTVLAVGKTSIDGGAAPRGMQVIAVTPAANAAVHNEELSNGAAFAQERAEREARLQRPLFVLPTKGIFTSGFGYRWGALHAGIDLAGPIGTPIYAAGDGVVVDAGPTAGYGAWVKIRHSDGAVTLYGHVNTWLVQIGQRVFAGDQIATIGNRGNSTGPHLHFSVLQNGTNFIDPVPWLAARGISLGPYVG